MTASAVVENKTTLDRILHRLENRLGVDPKDVKLEAKIREDLGIDSLERFDLLMELETEFGIELSDDEISEPVTVSDVVALVEKKRG